MLGDFLFGVVILNVLAMLLWGSFAVFCFGLIVRRVRFAVGILWLLLGFVMIVLLLDVFVV